VLAYKYEGHCLLKSVRSKFSACEKVLDTPATLVIKKLANREGSRKTEK